MIGTGVLIPRNRLKNVPQHLRFAHEYCYFLHDECTRLLVEYETARAHHVTVEFQSEVDSETFHRVAASSNIDALRAVGRPAEVRRVILNTITMAMVSDSLHHFFEALNCFEKRKSVVAFGLLRKPLLDSLIYLSWMLGNEDEFYEDFISGNPEKLSMRRLGNRRLEIIKNALKATRVEQFLNAEEIQSTIFDSKNKAGLYGAFQHAVHLITIEKVELRTTAENFNFIFKNPNDDDNYEVIYRTLPMLLLYFAHVVLELFDKINPMDKGSKDAFFTRSTLAYRMVSVDWSTRPVLDLLDENLGANYQCEFCETAFKFTEHNSARVLLTDTLRCTRCRRTQAFPLSWLF